MQLYKPKAKQKNLKEIECKHKGRRELIENNRKVTEGGVKV